MQNVQTQIISIQSENETAHLSDVYLQKKQRKADSAWDKYHKVTPSLQSAFTGRRFMKKQLKQEEMHILQNVHNLLNLLLFIQKQRREPECCVRSDGAFE